MQDATIIGGAKRSIRWLRGVTGLRRKLALILLVALFAGWGTLRAVELWTEWPARLVLRAGGDLYPGAFSPDGSVLSTRVYPTEEVILWDATTGRERTTWKPADKRRQFAGTFSPDGRTYASPWFIQGSGKNFSVDLIDIATGKVKSTVDSPLGGYSGLRFRDGGSTLRLLTVGPNSRTLLDVDAATGNVLASRPVAASAPTFLFGSDSLSADARWLAVQATGAAKGSTSLSIWDLDRDAEAFTIPGMPGGPAPARVAFSPDSTTLAVALDDGSIQLWDLTTRSLRRTAAAHGPNYRPVNMGFSTDGKTLASTGTIVIRSTLSFDFARAIMDHYLSGPDRPERTELVLLETSTGRSIRSSRRDGIAVFSPDGRTLAASQDDGTVRLYDLPKSP